MYKPIDYLLILRGMAAMAVVLRHVHLRLFSTVDLNWIVNPFGYIPVLVFFALSGYLITKTFVIQRYKITYQGISDYYRNRFFRIIPLYYFSILVCIVIYHQRAFQDPFSVLNLFIFKEAYNSTDGIIFNHVYWTLPVEVLFFILAPFIYMLFNRLNNLIGWHYILISLLLGYFCYSLYLFGEYAYVDGGIVLDKKTWNQLAHHEFFYNLEAFLIGSITNFIVQSKRVTQFIQSRKIRYLLKFIVVMGFLLMVMRGYYVGDKMFSLGLLDPFTLYCLVPLTGIFVAILCLLQDTQILEHKKRNNVIFYFLEWIGLLSYGIYLWHMPIKDSLLFLQNLNLITFNEMTLSLAVIFITPLFALMTFYFIERPFMKFRTKKLELTKFLSSYRSSGKSFYNQ